MAILEDEKLVELLHDRPEISRTVGNVYLGKVEAVLPGMQAAFVDIGAEKSAFLHAADLLEPDEKTTTTPPAVETTPVEVAGAEDEVEAAGLPAVVTAPASAKSPTSRTMCNADRTSWSKLRKSRSLRRGLG